jgi:hypothetical protein
MLHILLIVEIITAELGARDFMLPCSTRLSYVMPKRTARAIRSKLINYTLFHA